MAVIGGFRSDLSITRKTDGNFGNVSACVLFINENGGKNIKFTRGRTIRHQTNSFEALTLYCLYCSPLNFLRAS